VQEEGGAVDEVGRYICLAIRAFVAPEFMTRVRDDALIFRTYYITLRK